MIFSDYFPVEFENWIVHLIFNTPAHHIYLLKTNQYLLSFDQIGLPLLFDSGFLGGRVLVESLPEGGGGAALGSAEIVWVGSSSASKSSIAAFNVSHFLSNPL